MEALPFREEAAGRLEAAVRFEAAVVDLPVVHIAQETPRQRIFLYDEDEGGERTGESKRPARRRSVLFVEGGHGWHGVTEDVRVWVGRRGRAMRV